MKNLSNGTSPWVGRALPSNRMADKVTKDTVIGLRVSPEEKAILEAAAQREPLSSWVRRMALAAARVQAPPEIGRAAYPFPPTGQPDAAAGGSEGELQQSPVGEQSSANSSPTPELPLNIRSGK